MHGVNTIDFGNHTENCHQLKKEIKILIQKGQLLSYVKDVEGHPRKRSPPRENPSLENHAQKKGKNAEEVREARITYDVLNTIAGGFTRGGKTSSSRQRYARPVMHI